MKTKELIVEAKDKHRIVKSELLKLMDRLEMYNLSKEKIMSELFELYKKLK